MPILTRRQCLKTAAAGVAHGALLGGLGDAQAAEQVTSLAVQRRIIEVRGRAATIHSIRQPNGVDGLTAELGQRFRVRLTNELAENTLIGWHGLNSPSSQSGLSGVSRPSLAPGESYEYDFPILRSGSHWMSSTLGLQRQKLNSAPLIVRDPEDLGRDEQEVVIVLSDFTFREPEEIYADLRRGAFRPMAVNHEDGENAEQQGQSSFNANQPNDVRFRHHDVRFDAYLANDRTLDDPQIVPVGQSETVRLRIINAAAATNFMMDLGTLQGTLIAVDGNPIRPLRALRFPVAIAQRLDVRLRLPAGAEAFPILAQREGDVARTGIILAQSGASVSRISEQATMVTPGLSVERPLQAASQLAQRRPDRTNTINLTGSDDTYDWSLNMRPYDPQRPFKVRMGERIEMVLNNLTTMPHPMHLHGHRFQVFSIGNEPINGAIRDTVMIPAHQSVRIAFDADNPGRWIFQTQHLYQKAAGMMLAVEYVS